MAEDVNPLDWLDPEDLRRAQARLAGRIRETMREGLRHTAPAHRAGQGPGGRRPGPVSGPAAAGGGDRA